MHSLIAQMGYIVIATPDFEAAAADLVDILGLRISGRLDDRILLSSNSRFCEVAFVRSHYRGIRAVGLEAPDVAAVDEIARRVTSEDCTILDDKPSIPRVKHAVRFRGSAFYHWELWPNSGRASRWWRLWYRLCLPDDGFRLRIDRNERPRGSYAVLNSKG